MTREGTTTKERKRGKKGEKKKRGGREKGVIARRRRDACFLPVIEWMFALFVGIPFWSGRGGRRGRGKKEEKRKEGRRD